MDSELPPGQNPPPLNRPPPVIAPMQSPRPAKKGTGWKVFAIILLVLFAFSFLLNLRHAAGSLAGMKATDGSGPRLQEITVRDNKSSQKIAVIPVQGEISGSADGSGFSMVSIIKEQLRLATDDKEVKAVILKVDSPGGEVLASDEIAGAIRKFEKGPDGKPVIVSMGSLAASGGYYISVPSKWIVANELTITGSIGVIMEGLNYRGLLDKIGVDPMVFKSGKFKDMISPMKEPQDITPEEKQIIQDLVNQTYEKFKGVVKDGREAAFRSTPHPESDPDVSHGLADNWADFADGRVLSATDAMKLGFVDELGDFDVAVKRAGKIAGIGEEPNLIEYQPVFDLSSLFHLFGKTDLKNVKVDLGVDIPKLRPGCRYFLSPLFLP
jgi:protease IV